MELATSMNVLWDPPAVTVEATLDRLHAAGFRVLCMNFCDWLYEESPFVRDDWASWVESIGRRAEELGMRFCDAHGPIFPKFCGGEREERMTALSHRSIEASGVLEAPWVVFEPGTLAGSFTDEHRALNLQANLDWFGDLLPSCEKAGTGLALENVADQFSHGSGLGRTYCATPSELAELVDAFDREDVGAIWDTGHAHIQKLAQGESLRALGPRLKTTHIADNHGAHDEHLLPFYGTIDWEDVVAALREIEYAGDFSFEAHNSIRVLPDPLRDGALRHAVEIGRFLLGA